MLRPHDRPLHSPRRALRPRCERAERIDRSGRAEIGLEEQARATAEAAYKRGAKFVDVAYFDPYLKRVRIENVGITGA